MYPITAMMPRGTSVLPALLIVPSISLLVAYLYARATRPALPTWDGSGDPLPVYSFASADALGEGEAVSSGTDGARGGGGDLGRYMSFQEDRTYTSPSSREDLGRSRVKAAVLWPWQASAGRQGINAV